MSDFDLGYTYYMHDKIVEAKEIQANGSNLIMAGISLIPISIIIAITTGKASALLISGMGIGLIMLGNQKYQETEKIHAQKEQARKNINIELHHKPQKPHKVITIPSIIREKIVGKFSDDVSKHHAEREKIASIIEQNSGSDINTIYKIYRDSGGTGDAEHFVMALHALKKHGIVHVKEKI